MTSIQVFRLMTFSRCPLLLSLLLVVVGNPARAFAQVAVRGETVHTMAGAPIRDGVVLINGGKIERVGAASDVTIPAHYKRITARVVTPGLVDAHSVIGLAGYLNQPHDQMQLERSAADAAGTARYRRLQRARDLDRVTCGVSA